MGWRYKYHKGECRRSVNAGREIGLEVNVERTVSHHQPAGLNYNVKVANKSFKNAPEFKYLEQ